MLVLFDKSFSVPCQFTDRSEPPAGRLDQDSEGLLRLTDDGAFAHRVTDPRYKSPKTYLVQVEGTPDEAAVRQLRDGVPLKDGVTLPEPATALERAPDRQWPLDPPVRSRKTVPAAWLELTIHEGCNRQAPRMTAAVGLPTLRLIRTRTGGYTIRCLAPGTMRTI